ncbi:MAG: DUF4860 domain-containing protein [Ruminococcaceae bacterium]|nr:DUF4860 domain-containing protein [Oscillospiraceae bacterium]
MNKKSKNSFLSLVPLLLFFALTVCILYMCIMGISISKRIAARDNASFALRTACGYTTAKVQSATTRDDIGTESFGGCDALVIKEKHGGKDYLTRIYCYDGYLRELFSAADASLSPIDGEKLLKLDNMSFEKGNDTLSICFTESNKNTKTLVFYEVGE